MNSREGSLLGLAEAVADGSDVDWACAESGASDPDERRAIRQLRRLATIRAQLGTKAQTWGPLELREQIGSGVFGAVYCAWDPRLGREVALKLLRAQPSTARPTVTGVREARFLAQVRHPNVVTVFGADAFDGQFGLWMELIDGRTLKEIQEQQGSFGAHEAAVIGLDLCRAIAAVHRLGLLHRDIKAQNVMREEGGRIVLMDFGTGIASHFRPDTQPPLAGTPMYLAPELLTGGAPTVKSDLYSLGILLFYLVSGSFPVAGQSLTDVRDNHAENKRTFLRDARPDLPASFVRVVDQMIATDPSARPESAGAVEALLESALRLRGGDSAMTGQMMPGGTSRRLKVAPLRRKVLYAVATLAVSGLAAVAAKPLWRTFEHTRRDSVAVLPFRNLSIGQENDYFGDGVAADIVAQLARLGGLKVISATSVERYKDRRKSPLDIGAELNVATVLDGSIRWSGDRVRIVGQLVDTHTGEQLWSESFDREIKDIFVIQSEVARRIAIALKGELSTPEAERMGSHRARDFEAFNLYLKGRYQWSLRTEDGFNSGIQYFEEAIKRDPKYAAAYAGLADAYTLLGVYGMLPRTEASSRASAAALRAIELDDTLAEAHASLGYVQKNRWEWDAAEASFKRAIALKPGYPAAHQWYAVQLAQHARFGEAITESKTALSLDPLSIGANSQFGAILLLARRYDEAITQMERTLQMDSGFAAAHQIMAEAYAYKGAYDRALSEVGQTAKVSGLGREDQEWRADMGYIFARAGRHEDALRVVNELAERYWRNGDAVTLALATIHGALGQHDQAFDWLAIAQERADPGLGYLKVDPRWDSLRDDSRFRPILVNLGLDR